MSQKIFIKDEYTCELRDLDTGEIVLTLECYPNYVKDKPDEIICLPGKVENDVV